MVFSLNRFVSLVQLSPDQCVVDGTLDGLLPGESHLVQVHEYGDLSSGCGNCGDVLGMMKRSQEGQVSGCGHCYYIKQY